MAAIGFGNAEARIAGASEGRPAHALEERASWHQCFCSRRSASRSSIAADRIFHAPDRPRRAIPCRRLDGCDRAHHFRADAHRAGTDGRGAERDRGRVHDRRGSRDPVRSRWLHVERRELDEPCRREHAVYKVPWNVLSDLEPVSMLSISSLIIVGHRIAGE